MPQNRKHQRPPGRNLTDGLVDKRTNRAVSLDHNFVSRLPTTNDVVTGLYGHQGPYLQSRNLESSHCVLPNFLAVSPEVENVEGRNHF